MAHRRKKHRRLPASDDTLMPPLEQYQHDVIERAQSSRGAKAADRPPLRVTTQTMLERYLTR